MVIPAGSVEPGLGPAESENVGRCSFGSKADLAPVRV
jgi:hypothetical protein